MPRYKLTYFDTPGIGEMIRFLLSYGDEDFEDERVDFAKWFQIRDSTSYGALPMFEMDGKSHYQSLAIGRYLAKKYKLAGDNDLENLEIDTLVDVINDFRWQFTNALWEPNAESEAEKRKLLVNEKLPFYLNRFTDQVEENGGYFYGGRVTWADIWFASLIPYLDFAIGFETLKDHKILKELTEKIYAIPNIRKWIENRPTGCCLKDYFAGK